MKKRHKKRDQDDLALPKRIKKGSMLTVRMGPKGRGMGRGKA